jgi:Protein of unknown function (DUF1583)
LFGNEQGLRISLPLGFPGERPFTGGSFEIPIKGDFDITVRFEVLHEPGPENAREGSTRLVLGAILNRGEGGRAALAWRIVRQTGETVFSSYVTLSAPDGSAERHYSTCGTSAKCGRLRLLRKGSQLSFYAAEDRATEFTLLQEYPFAAADLRAVELVGVTGGAQEALDVRFSDLRILTGSSVVAPTSSNLVWKMWLALLIGLVLLLGLGLQLFYSRRRHRLVQALPDDAEASRAAPP